MKSANGPNMEIKVASSIRLKVFDRKFVKLTRVGHVPKIKNNLIQ